MHHLASLHRASRTVSFGHSINAADLINPASFGDVTLCTDREGKSADQSLYRVEVRDGLGESPLRGQLAPVRLCPEKTRIHTRKSFVEGKERAPGRHGDRSFPRGERHGESPTASTLSPSRNIFHTDAINKINNKNI